MTDRPWLDEPDELEFEAHGLPCRIKRNCRRPERNPKDWLGHLCGYVGLPPEHPYFGRSYDDIEEVDVHGGLTYSIEDTENKIHWVGFDCAHAGDLIPGIFELRQPGGILHEIELEYAGIADTEVYRDINFVKAQCESLAKQLSEVKK